ncbi:MAG TPA: MurR/RpiR family transcriptional regulator [Chloroflexota bacterium]|nr:MurR/RpiR family transcriptional regulator [Chloroflexota bacterium]
MDGRFSNGALARLRAALPAMKPAERVVAEWILARPGDASRSTAAAVAEAAGVGFGSVMRACGRAGYREFGALRTALAVELLAPPALGGTGAPAPQPGDPPEVVIHSVFAAAAQGLRDTAGGLSAATVARAVAALAGARLTAVFGAGSVSGAIAQLMQVRLLGAGLAACCYTNANDHAPAAAGLGPDDVAVGISQSGDTASVRAALEAAHAAGAATVALTAYAQSAIAQVADLVLVTAIAPALHGEPATSRVPMLALIDALAVAVLLQRAGDSRPEAAKPDKRRTRLAR